jgi:hypothetical protein
MIEFTRCRRLGLYRLMTAGRRKIDSGYNNCTSTLYICLHNARPNDTISNTINQITINNFTHINTPIIDVQHAALN